MALLLAQGRHRHGRLAAQNDRADGSVRAGKQRPHFVGVSNAYGYHNSAVLGRTYYYRVRPVRIFSNGDVSVGDWSDELAYTHQETVGTYRALLIGNTYTGESNELPGCDNDVDGMRTMLGRMTATPYSVTVKKNIRAEEILSIISSTFGNASYNDVSRLRASKPSWTRFPARRSSSSTRATPGSSLRATAR